MRTMSDGFDRRCDRLVGMRILRGLALSDIVAAFIALCLCTVAVWRHMQVFPELSPYDEATHIDYVFTIASLDLPALGTPYDQRVFSEWSCRGAYSDVTNLPPCSDTAFLPDDFPGRGIQRNPTGPLYYTVVAALTQPAASVTGTSPLGAARLSGILFLWTTMLLTVVGARMIGTSRMLTWSIATAIPLGMPLVLHATSTVNSDAGALLVGALVLPLALRQGESTRRWRGSVLGLGVVAGLTKQTALFPIGLLSITIAMNHWPSGGRDSSRWRSVALAAAACIAALLSLGVWTAVVNARTLDSYVDPIGMGNTVAIDGNPVDEALTGLAENVPPTNIKFVPPALRTPFQPTTLKILTVVFLSALGAALVATERRVRSLAWGVLAGSVASALLIQAYLAFGEDRFHEAPNARYAIGLVPASLVLVAAFFDSRRELRIAGWTTICLCLSAAAASLHI